MTVINEECICDEGSTDVFLPDAVEIGRRKVDICAR